jgi:hypothetical protein
VKVENISGGPFNFPLLGRDIQAYEVFEVPDDTILPAHLLRPVADKPVKAKDKDKDKE